MLNPTVVTQLSSPPLSPQETDCYAKRNSISNGKPRSRFSDEEDAIICEGVARGLTWGQISGQLPHRKRATCFNRYRTLQGIRKSRKRSMPSPPITPPSSWSPPQETHRHHPYLVAPLPTRFYAERLH